LRFQIEDFRFQISDFRMPVHVPNNQQIQSEIQI